MTSLGSNTLQVFRDVGEYGFEHRGSEAARLRIVEPKHVMFYLEIQRHIRIMHRKNTLQNTTMRINAIKYIQWSFGHHFLVHRSSRRRHGRY